MTVEDEDDDSEEEKKEPATASNFNWRSSRPKFELDVDSLPTISFEEVQKHNTNSDCWTIVDGLVYDVSSYVPYHPGGKKKILLGAGKEASEMFRK